MIKVVRTVRTAVVLVGFAGACTPTTPIDAKKTTQSAAVNAGEAISRAGKALSFTLADDGTLKKTSSAATTSAGNVVVPMMTGAMPPAMLKAMIGPTLSREVAVTPMPSVMTAQEKFDNAATEIRRLMEERLFVDSNLEGTSGDTATYRLKADPTCRPLPADSDPPGTVPEIDSKCQEDLDKVEVRIAVTDDGDGARLRVLIGPSRIELVAFVVHSELLAMEVDLPMAKAASDHIRQRLDDGSGNTSSPTGTYDRLTGKLGFSLKKIGDQAVTAAASILQPVDVAMTDGAEFITAATDPLFAITGDGVSKTAELQAGLGATEIDSVWDPKLTGAKNRDERTSIGGYYGRITLDENAKTIVVTDAGIGELKIAIRGMTVFDLNLNPDAMRRFSGVITVNADDTAHIVVTPKFDLSLAFDYASIVNDYATPPAMEVLHDTYGVMLTNGGSASAIDTVKSTDTFTGGLRVAAGTLSVSVASAPDETVNVPVGKCLSAPASAPAGKNVLLGALLVGDCP